MARPRGTRRAAAAAADPAASDEAAADGPPAPPTLRKRSHADALGHNTTSALPTATGAAETSPRRSKRGKTGKEADADEADSLRAAPQGAAPHAAAASRLDPYPSSSTLATSSDLGIENADHPDVDRPLGADSAAAAAAGDNEMTAQERRALKGKAKATDEDEDQVMAENLASEDDVQKQLRELNELVASQTAILASLHSAVTCNVCLERLEQPFALQCGHVFCRSCLINWFFRPRTDGEEEEEEEEGESGGGNAPASSSSSESDASSDAGHSRAREIRSTVANASTSAAAAVRAPSESAEEIAQRRRVEADLWGDLSGPSTSAANAAGTTTGAAGGRIPPLEAPPAVSAEEEAELSADALRRARLARFDSRRPVESAETASIGTSEVAGPSSDVRAPSRAPPPPAPPTASLATAETAAATSTTAAATSRAAGPAPIPFPVRAPSGEHRIQNLVCPQCRASCAMRAPQRIFALDEVLSTLSRARVNEQGTRPRSASPVKLMRKVDKKGDDEDARGEGEIDPNLLDEKDKTWGGLFPGEGGTESSRDRRRRLAQVVRDREDGVRRCGHCNWELDERTGICEGCGRQWDISSDDSDSDSSVGGLLPFRRGFLGRQHHDLAHSSGSGSEGSGESDGGSGGSSARGEPIAFRPGRESNEDDNDSYESDFVVKSDYDDEDGGRPGANAASRWKAIRHPSTDDSSSSSSADDSEDEVTTQTGRDRRPRQRRRARSVTGSSSSSDDSVKWTRRRSPNPDPSSSDDDDDGAERSRERAKRRRRLQGEVIDPDSDSRSDSASADDDSNSGETSSGSSSEEEEEEGAPRTTRSGRRIAAPAGGRIIDVSGFDTSSGDDDYSAQESRGSGGSGITDEESSSSLDREAPKGTKARASPTKKKKRAIAASSDDD